MRDFSEFGSSQSAQSRLHRGIARIERTFEEAILEGEADAYLFSCALAEGGKQAFKQVLQSYRDRRWRIKIDVDYKYNRVNSISIERPR